VKITICGSMAHAKEMVKAYHDLKKIGHEPLMHPDVFGIADGTARELVDGIAADHSEVKRRYNFIKVWHSLILQGDAILICNFDKGKIKNYIGGNVLMEIGFAHTADKKVYLMNPVPTDLPYVDEIKAMVDEVLNRDLKKIENIKTKIMIGGSMVFAKEMKKAKRYLEAAGFEVFVPLDTEYVIVDPEKKNDMEFLRKLGVGLGDAALVAKADAFLVLNYDKHGIKGYIGPGAYRDISVAWWHRKKIFFLNPYDENQNNHKYEMLGFKPIILDGDLSKIAKVLNA